MRRRKLFVPAVCATLGAVVCMATARPAAAQTNCTASANAAVECFVANAVTTKLTKPRYGMTLGQFKTYGVAVSQILQTHHTYLVLTGLASAIADAMPPKNANGTENQSAQDIAVSQIVDAATTANFTPAPTGTTSQDLQWFTLDLVSAMNDNDGVMQLLTPGVGLRIIDSYVVTATSGGNVNWTEADSKISTAIQNLIASGMLKIPAGMTVTEVKTFANSVAKAIYAYKVATNRTAL
jgi:hypothetical protein